MATTDGRSDSPPARLPPEVRRRQWIATIAVILLVLAVWKFIDWRMQPPPPPALQSPAAASPAATR